MRRELGAFESALTLSDAHAPLNVVAVLRLEAGPPAEVLERGLEALRLRHPLLRARIAAEGGRYFFELRRVPAIPLRVVPRQDDAAWVEETEAELDERLDSGRGPLLRCAYLASDGTGACEILLTFHHAIMDAASATSLFKELLTVCGELEAGRVPESDEAPLLPAVEDSFPSAFRGWRRRQGVGRFMLRMLGAEVVDRWRARGRWNAPPPEPTRNRILSFQLSENETRALVRRSRRRRLTLHSVFDAATLLAVARRLYAGQSLPLRHLVFANLRPYLTPPVADENLGACFAMLRFTTALGPHRDLWKLAAEINAPVHAASKRGAKYLFQLTSAAAMRFLLRRDTDRMAATAISYTGPVRFDAAAPYRVRGLHAFVSNFRLGPEYTAQIRLYDSKLWWDILYLEPELDSPAARRLAGDIHALLTADETTP